MDMAVRAFLLQVPQAAAIWLVLIGAAVVAVAAMSVPARRAGTALPRRGAAAAAAARARVAAEEAELRRYADEVAVAAGRAEATARRSHAAWEAAQYAADVAWRDFEAADAAAARAASAAAFPAPRVPVSAEAYAERERYLRRVATAAYQRGELSMEQLGEAFTHRGDWDPRRHPVEQEALLRRAARAHRLAAYRAAAAHERAAWHDADLAAAARASLRAEAHEAVAAAERLATALTAGRDRRRTAAAARPGRARVAVRTARLLAH
jgi:hypothetical protein